MAGYRIPGSIAVANAKGGVGKTTVTANLAALTAQAGTEALIVDLDPQANLATEFGIEGHDEGRGLLAAAMNLGEVQVVPTGRPGLSYVAAGSDTAKLATLAMVEGAGDPTALAKMLEPVLRPLARSGEVRLFFDTPPSGGNQLADTAGLLGEWLLIPTKTDRNSLNGVPTMLRRLLEISNGNLIHPLGVALFDVNPQATVVNRETRAELEEALDGAFPVLNAAIRHADKAQRDSKDAGIIAAEYAHLAETADVKPWYQAVRDGDAGDRLTFAGNAATLAEDYHQLFEEVESIMTKVAKP